MPKYEATVPDGLVTSSAGYKEITERRKIDIVSNIYMVRFTLIIILSFTLLSCAPTILYLGDSYPPVSSVDVYYDGKEVKKEYKVIGRMTNGEVVTYGPEIIKQKMIEKAQQVGADGIIFSSISIGDADKEGEIKAELIKFL